MAQTAQMHGKAYTKGSRIDLKGDGTEKVGDTVRIYDANPVSLAVVKQIAHMEGGGTDLICEITQIGV